MQKQVGIITYHSAYNFGSVLQAYATERAVDMLGHKVTILNYRMNSQYEYYKTIHTNLGIKRLAKDLLYIPVLRKYDLRKQRFESFIASMNLTKEFKEPEDAKEYADSFDVFLSGSDQIWNKHSNELLKVDWKYMNPYLLTFTDKKKISYASSIVNMQDNELGLISNEIKKFSSVSFREKNSCERMKSVFGIDGTLVADPTLLIDAEHWRTLESDLPKSLENQKYILYYALEGIKQTTHVMPELKAFAKKNGLKLVVITPLSPLVNTRGIINAIDSGPQEFLRLIDNAKLVITNSYHGTLFSVNLSTPFYVLRKPDSKDERIPGILQILKLQDRIVNGVNEINNIENLPDFETAHNILKDYRRDSAEYMKKAIGDEHE